MTSIGTPDLSLHHRLYLHFLDRELAASVKYRPDEASVRHVISCLLIASPAPMYCGLSPAWETSYKLGSLAAFLAKLERARQLDLVSNHSTQEEFLAARIEAYKHDADRYPMYFGDDHQGVSQLKPTLLKTGSATESLRAELLTWSDLPHYELHNSISDKEVRKKLLKAVRKTLDSEREGAVTLALFRERLGRLMSHPQAVGLLSREISKRYTEHYRVSQAGEIPTGLKGLAVFDSLSQMFPFYDVPLLANLVDHLGASILVSESRLEEFLACRGQESHHLFVDRLRVFIGGICAEVGVRPPCPPSASTREHLRQKAASILASGGDLSITGTTVADLLFALTFKLNAIIQKASRSSYFAKGVAAMEQEVDHPKTTKVLLVVAAEVEHDAVLNAATEHGLPKYQRLFAGDHTYFALGNLGGCDLFLVKCTAGSGGVSGALATTMDAVRDLQPNAIIMPGIAFGLKPDKQKLCEVLISKQVMAYDLKRLTEDKDGNITIKPRGDRVPASPRLFDRFWSGARDWKVTNVHDGLILSGDTLVDSPKFKAELLSIEPEAIGGEMEGAGVYVASLKAHIDWIIIKAICDWGEKKDKKVQEPAAKNAVDLVFHVIRQGGIRQ